MWEGFQRQRQKDLRIVKVGRGNELKTPSGALIYVPERLVEQQCRQREWVGWSILGFRCEHDRSCGSWMNTPMAISQQKASSDVHSRSTWDRGCLSQKHGWETGSAFPGELLLPHGPRWITSVPPMQAGGKAKRGQIRALLFKDRTQKLHTFVPIHWSDFVTWSYLATREAGR